MSGRSSHSPPSQEHRRLLHSSACVSGASPAWLHRTATLHGTLECSASSKQACLCRKFRCNQANFPTQVSSSLGWASQTHLLWLYKPLDWLVQQQHIRDDLLLQHSGHNAASNHVALSSALAAGTACPPGWAGRAPLAVVHNNPGAGLCKKLWPAFGMPRVLAWLSSCLSMSSVIT